MADEEPTNVQSGVASEQSKYDQLISRADGPPLPGAACGPISTVAVVVGKDSLPNDVSMMFPPPVGKEHPTVRSAYGTTASWFTYTPIVMGLVTNTGLTFETVWVDRGLTKSLRTAPE